MGLCGSSDINVKEGLSTSLTYNNGKNLLNRLSNIPNKGIEINFGINNYSNNKKNIETDISDNIVKTEPSTELLGKINNKDNQFNHIKTKTNNIQFNRIHRTLYPKKFNYNNQASASYFRYLHSKKKVPNYKLVKINNHNNLIKNFHNNDILKSSYISKDRKLILQRNNETITNSKKNPFVTISNTVINYNIIDTGIILPSFNKLNDKKKFKNYISPYNVKEKNGLKYTDFNRTLSDALANEQILDMQGTIEALSRYYYTNGESFDGISVAPEYQDRFEYFASEAIDYYDE